MEWACEAGEDEGVDVGCECECGGGGGGECGVSVGVCERERKMCAWERKRSLFIAYFHDVTETPFLD